MRSIYSLFHVCSVLRCDIMCLKSVDANLKYFSKLFITILNAQDSKNQHFLEF